MVEPRSHKNKSDGAAKKVKAEVEEDEAATCDVVIAFGVVAKDGAMYGSKRDGSITVHESDRAPSHAHATPINMRKL